MKKKAQELKQIEGWTALTRVRGFCTDCGSAFSFENVVYWRKNSGRSEINCENCVGKRNEL